MAVAWQAVESWGGSHCTAPRRCWSYCTRAETLRYLSVCFLGVSEPSVRTDEPSGNGLVPSSIKIMPLYEHDLRLIITHALYSHIKNMIWRAHAIPTTFPSWLRVLNARALSWVFTGKVNLYRALTWLFSNCVCHWLDHGINPFLVLFSFP